MYAGSPVTGGHVPCGQPMQPIQSPAAQPAVPSLQLVTWSAALQTTFFYLNLELLKPTAALCEASNRLAICVLIMTLTSKRRACAFLEV